MLRKLRIAFSATCLIACVLLIVLWVRSYLRLDQFSRPISATEYFACTSGQGQLMLGKSNDPQYRQLFGEGWTKRGFAWADWNETTGGPACFPASVPIPRGRDIIRGLRFRKDPFYPPGMTSYEVVVPYWLSFWSAAMLGVIPWLHWRFSLRTLLIATTLVALALGLIVWSDR
jgi:hypothetical protein